MSNGLSQAEIDALLRGEAVPGIEDTPEAPQEEASAQILSQKEIAEAFGKAEEEENAAPPEDEMPSMSREEIDSAFEAAGMAPPESDANQLTPIEIDAVGEIGNISMGTSATTLFSLLNRKVEITTPKVSITTMGEVAKTYPIPFVAVEVCYTVGLQGTNVLFLRESDVKIITDLMLGGDGSDVSGELNDMHLSCIGEVMNQMMGSSATSLSKMLGTTIDISPPKSYRVDLSDKDQRPFNYMDESVVKTSFDMVVEGLINSEIMQVTPIGFAKDMVKTLMGVKASVLEETPPPPPPSPEPQPDHAPPSTPVNGAAASTQYAQPPGQTATYPPYPQQNPYPGPQGGGYPQMQYGNQAYTQQAAEPVQQPVDVRAMKFNTFDSAPIPGEVGENMDLLMDVPLQVSVELGKSRKYIKEILDFNVGTIVVLDKMAGELVDVVVNGKLIARGEVVVIEESYGCRITDIVSPSKRINTDK